MSYASWAFGVEPSEAGIPWVAISVVPCTAAVLRATQLVLRGDGADPEDRARDPGVALAGAIAGLLIVASLYLWDPG